MSDAPTIGCLFDGVHGFGLGLAAIGARAAWTVELGDFPRSILNLRVPDAEHMADVRDVHHPPRVDWLTGGFPCQDLSVAGLGKGITGSRSGLWTEYARIIGEVRPALVLIENVPALLHRGMELVVANLVELGYHVEWDCIPAAALGAPHLRDRVWIAAHHHPEPVAFGQPAALFPMPPAGAADLVGGDDDPDDAPAGWQRWPRAGWVDTDPALVMPLEPLAPRAATRTGGATPAGAPLLPTPTAQDASNDGGPSQHRRNTPPLNAIAARWPTPASMDATPNAADADRGPDYARNGRDHNGGRPASGGDDLVTAIARAAVPTPRASDGDRGGRGDGREHERRSGALNPAWVEWLMGFPLRWTDPRVPNDALTAHAWAHGEPPGVPRTTTDAQHRRDRLHALGNALVPPIPAWIAHRYQAATRPARAA